MHPSITPSLQYSSLPYLGASRLSATKHMSLFSSLPASFQTSHKREIEGIADSQRLRYLASAARLVQVAFELLIGHHQIFDNDAVDIFISFGGDTRCDFKTFFDVSDHPRLVTANIRRRVAHGAEHAFHQFGLLLDFLPAGNQPHPRQFNERSSPGQDLVTFFGHIAGKWGTENRGSH